MAGPANTGGEKLRAVAVTLSALLLSLWPSIRSGFLASSCRLLSIETPARFRDKANHLKFLAVLTPLYLLGELSFTAALLDVVGSAPDLAAIERIERVGRAVSGIAIALLLWGFIVLPIIRRVGYSLVFCIALLTASGALSIVVAYRIQDAIVQSILARASPEERQSALLLGMATRAIVSGDIALAGISLGADELATPAGKAFVALLPALALNMPDLLARTQPALDVIAARMVLSRGMVPADVLFQTYQRTRDRLREDHERILPLIASLSLDSETLDAQVAAKWDAYVAQIARARMTVGAIPRQHWPRIREELARSGLPMPDDWSPNDRAGFFDLVRAGLVQQHLAAFQPSVEASLGYPAPPIADFDEYFLHPAIQLHLAKAGILSTDGVAHDLDLDGFMEVYRDTARAAVDLQIQAVLADPAEFAPDGAYYDAGKTAAKIAWVPVVALLFSAIGGVTHTVKTISLWSKLLATDRKLPFVKWGPGLAVGFVLLVAPLIFSSSVTSSALFESLPGSNIVLRWLIDSQPVLYPVGKSVSLM